MNRSRLATIAAMALCALGCFAPAAEAAKEKVIYSFQNNGADGYFPAAQLTVANGKLYGTTSDGGVGRCEDGCGTIFSVDPATGAETVVHSFEGKETGGAVPGSLILAGDKLFGSTEAGGRRGNGMLFSLDPASGAFQTLYSFCDLYSCTDGAGPSPGLLDWKGELYDTTGYYGQYNRGVIFSFDPKTLDEKALYSFSGVNPNAQGGLIHVYRRLYGMTEYGGSGCTTVSTRCDMVFSINLAKEEETTIYSFCSQDNCGDGAYPQGGLIEYDRTLYGVTLNGGVGTNCGGPLPGCGVVFSIDPVTGVETVLHAFQSTGGDSQLPYSGLTQANGLLYGTTFSGGKYGKGTVYSIDPLTGEETVVYSFCKPSGCANGARPEASLVSLNGVLYGTTSAGGKGTCGGSGCGTVFAITP
jgi:uncharacterized repeat protein (TIGR03803 family)